MYLCTKHNKEMSDDISQSVSQRGVESDTSLLIDKDGDMYVVDAEITRRS